MKIKLSGTVFAVLVFAGWSLKAQSTIVDLGYASGFGVLADTAITNTGATIINGNLGLYPGTSVTGFPPGTVNGTMSAGNALAGQAQTSLALAYNAAAGSYSGTVFYAPISDLGGSTLTPGVYNDPSSFGITGNLTLNANGNPNAFWIFQAGSTLTTAANSHIILENDAQAGNVFWQVGSSATLGALSSFAGTILANDSITLGTGASVDGGLLAENGAVTLDNNNVVDSAVPEPALTSLLVAGTVCMAVMIRRYKSRRAL